MTGPRTIVLVGGGLAGAKTAERLRAQGFDGRVVLVGASPSLLATFENDVVIVDADWQARNAAPRLRDGRWVV